MLHPGLYMLHPGNNKVFPLVLNIFHETPSAKIISYFPNETDLLMKLEAFSNDIQENELS